MFKAVEAWESHMPPKSDLLSQGKLQKSALKPVEPSQFAADLLQNIPAQGASEVCMLSETWIRRIGVLAGYCRRLFHQIFGGPRVET